MNTAQGAAGTLPSHVDPARVLDFDMFGMAPTSSHPEPCGDQAFAEVQLLGELIPTEHVRFHNPAGHHPVVGPDPVDAGRTSRPCGPP